MGREKRKERKKKENLGSISKGESFKKSEATPKREERLSSGQRYGGILGETKRGIFRGEKRKEKERKKNLESGIFKIILSWGEKKGRKKEEKSKKEEI